MQQIKFIHTESSAIAYPIGAKLINNKKSINTLKKLMKETIGPKKHITLWCRGSSGAIIAALVSNGFPNCIINHVKKQGEYSHSRGHYTIIDNTTNIIIDDFSNTGETLNEIYYDMKKEDVKKVDYVCVLGHVNSVKLDFLPKVIIGRELYLDRQENKLIKKSAMIEKYIFSENYKVVNDEVPGKVIHKNFFHGDYKVTMNESYSDIKF